MNPHKHYIVHRTLTQMPWPHGSETAGSLAAQMERRLTICGSIRTAHPRTHHDYAPRTFWCLGCVTTLISSKVMPHTRQINYAIPGICLIASTNAPSTATFAGLLMEEAGIGSFFYSISCLTFV
jgi:hypothetical protein